MRRIEGRGGGGGSGGTGGRRGSSKPAVAAKKKPKRSKITIQQAARRLSDLGYTLTGPAAYDLRNQTARYNVTKPDGSSSVMTHHEILALI